MVARRFSFIIPLSAILCALFLHIATVAIIYYGGQFAVLFPKNSANIIYAEIEIIEEKETETLHWVKISETSINFGNDKAGYGDYSYKKNEPFDDISPTDVLIKLYETPSDFLLEQIIYEAEILPYAQDMIAIEDREKKQIFQSHKSSAYKKTPSVSQKAKKSASISQEAGRQGEKQSARCQIGRAVSSQQPQKPAHVKILVGKNGHIQTVSLTRSSGVRNFDNAALRAARRAKCRPEIIKGVPKAANIHIRISPG